MRSTALLVVAGPGGTTDVGLVDLNCSPTVAPAIPSSPRRTFYVDAARGDDANAGSATLPWRTLDKANSSVRPGDAVYLKGTFTNQWIHPQTSGTATDKIVFEEWPGEIAVLDGGIDGAAVFLSGLSHIVVDGLELRNALYVVTLANAHDNWLRNLYVHDVDEIWLEGAATDNRIEDSRIERCGNEAQNTGDCIWIANGSHRNVIARNTMRFGGHALIDIGGDKAGMASSDDNVVEQNDLSNGWSNNMGLLGFANRTIVECNLIHDATQQTTINYPRAGMNINASNNVVRYNLIYGNKSDGIQVQGYNFQGALFSPSKNQIYQNTVYGNGGAGLQISQQGDGVVSDNVIADNIFWNNNLGGATAQARYYEGSSYAVWIDLYNSSVPWPDQSLNGNVLQNNIIGPTDATTGKQWLMIVVRTGNRIYTLAQAQAALPQVTANRAVDPLLNSDFTLQAGSPAIDAGRVLFPDQQFRGSAPDLGAREKS